MGKFKRKKSKKKYLFYSINLHNNFIKDEIHNKIIKAEFGIGLNLK